MPEQKEKDAIHEAIKTLMNDYDSEITQAMIKVDKFKLSFSCTWESKDSIKVGISFPTGSSIKDETVISLQQGLFDKQENPDAVVTARLYEHEEEIED